MGWCNDTSIELLECDQGRKPNLERTACSVCDSQLGGFDIPDNGIDENCDGVDATHSESRGFYIDPVLGNDNSGDGTQANPFKSFLGVTDIGWPSNPNKRELYLAAGTLTDNLTTDTGVKIMGGYSRNGSNVWTRSTANTTILRVTGTALDFSRPSGASDAFYVDGVTIQVNQGTTRRGVVYNGNTDLFLQNVALVGDAAQSSNCDLIYQDYSYLNQFTVVNGSLNISNSSLTGCSYAINGSSYYLSATSNYLLSIEHSAVSTPIAKFAGNRSFIYRSTLGSAVFTGPIGVGNHTIMGSTVTLAEDRAVDTIHGYRSSLISKSSSILQATYQLVDCYLQMAIQNNLLYNTTPSYLLGGGISGTPRGLPRLIENATLNLSSSLILFQTIRDSHAQGAFLLNGDPGAAFDRNLVVGNMSFYSGSNDTLVRNNLFLGSTSSPQISIAGNQGSTGHAIVFSNNTIVNTNTTGVTDCKLVSVNSRAEFYNNLFACAGNSGSKVGIVEEDPSFDVTGLRGNVFAGLDVMFVSEGSTNLTSLSQLNAMADISDASKKGGNQKLTLLSDALFTDVPNRNFTPIASSPLVDTGFDTSTSVFGQVRDDLPGHGRPCGTSFDVGAYEVCP